MSYSVVSLGATVVTPDKRPASSVDLVATWARMKDVLRKTLDEYRFGDKSLRTFNGQRLPMATVQHAVVTHDWLARVASKMMAAAKKAGRPTDKMQAALTKYNAAFSKFKSTAKDSFSGRLPIEQCYAFIDATDHFAIELSAAQWAAFNTGTPEELLREAFNETPGGSLLVGVFDAGKTIVGAGGAILDTASFAVRNLSTIVKIGALLGVGFVGWRIYTTKPWEMVLGKKKEAPTD